MTANNKAIEGAIKAEESFVIMPSPTQSAVFKIFLSVGFLYHCSAVSIAPIIKATASTSLLIDPENRINAG